MKTKVFFEDWKTDVTFSRSLRDKMTIFHAYAERYYKDGLYQINKPFLFFKHSGYLCVYGVYFFSSFFPQAKKPGIKKKNKGHEENKVNTTMTNSCNWVFFT